MRHCPHCGTSTATADAHGVWRCPNADHPPLLASVTKTLARSHPAAGGSLTARLDPVHAHDCPAWRMGRRHGPCNCGAHDMLAEFLAQHAEDPWHGVSATPTAPWHVTVPA